jgi:hypothetical protein
VEKPDVTWTFHATAELKVTPNPNSTTHVNVMLAGAICRMWTRCMMLLQKMTRRVIPRINQSYLRVTPCLDADMSHSAVMPVATTDQAGSRHTGGLCLHDVHGDMISVDRGLFRQVLCTATTSFCSAPSIWSTANPHARLLGDLDIGSISQRSHPVDLDRSKDDHFSTGLEGHILYAVAYRRVM